MVQNISPFRFGQIVDSVDFTNRHQEMKILEANLFSSNNIVIMSPRRYGKSSLIKQFLLRNADKQKAIHCVIDLFGVQSEEEFYETFARELIKASSGKLDEWLENAKNFFTQLIPRISVGTDPNTDFSISFDFKEIRKNRAEVLNLPAVIAERKNKQVIVYLDEFQNVGSFKDSLAFQKLLRSVWQKHKNVAYCMYGSKRHMMREIFEQTDKPFYRFGSQFTLERIATEHWLGFIGDKFAQTKKEIPEELIIQLIERMGNHPHYVQQMAHFVWSFSDKKVSQEVLDYALNFMLTSNSAFFVKIVEDLSQTQVNLLKAIANGEEKLTGKNVMQEYNVGTPRNITKNKKVMEGKDIIDTSSVSICFIDPLFEIWFKKNVVA